jgi:hypothetical protein
MLAGMLQKQAKSAQQFAQNAGRKATKADSVKAN